MVHFASKRNATPVSVTPFPTLLSFFYPKLKNGTGRRAYANVITRISDIDWSPFCFFLYGALAARALIRARGALL